MKDDEKFAKTIIKILNIALVLVILVFVLVSIIFAINILNDSEAQNEILESGVSGAAVTQILDDMDPVLSGEVTQNMGTDEQGDAGSTGSKQTKVEEIATQTTSDFPLSSSHKMITLSPELNEEYISNPGIGWIYKWGETQLSVPDTSLLYSNRIDIAWKVLNPTEGQYNWDPLDLQLETAVEQGKQYSFRVYTMVGEGFAGHMVPLWVIDKGAAILSTGEPDYSNCVYQSEWAKFVSALIERYDGNPNIAFIDISGYGNFNEWGWSNSQTVWDDEWETSYQMGIINPGSFSSLDGKARRRLADIFIGGSNNFHQCRNKDGTISMESYEYGGFQETQLVMPFAGIVQSTQYVFMQNENVGFRYDCLGRSSSVELFSRIEDEIDEIWRRAPVIFETCSANDFNLGVANNLIESNHGSVIHNVNIDNIQVDDIYGLIDGMGYKYYLSEVKYTKQVAPGGVIEIEMIWKNIGNAPAYPKMGQNFKLMFYLIDDETDTGVEIHIVEDISKWMPAEDFEGEAPANAVNAYVDLPSGIEAGIYETRIAIIDLRTGLPINLALHGRDNKGRYKLATIEIFD